MKKDFNNEEKREKPGSVRLTKHTINDRR